MARPTGESFRPRPVCVGVWSESPEGWSNTLETQRRVRIRTHGVGLGGLDVHVARFFDGLHQHLLRGRVEALDINVGEAKQFGEATAEQDGGNHRDSKLGGCGHVHVQTCDRARV